MTQVETPQPTAIPIEHSRPHGDPHPMLQTSVLDGVTQKYLPSQEVVPLAAYLKDIAGKPRGSATGGKEDLNSHAEEFIIKDGQGIRVASLEQLQTLLRAQGVKVDVLGIASIGNANQRVTAMVQGVDRNKPTSGFERPTVAEGPHMILAPYAYDKDGKLHLFRAVQMRTGQAMIDTPRGFADAQTLKDGQELYEVEKAGEKVTANMKRIVGEESGDALKIKRITFFGAPRVNSSFVTSKSAVFGVEVDYDAFIKAQKVLKPEEVERRKRELDHEGLVGGVLDITLPEYVDYKNDSRISKDMAADFGTDTVVIDHLFESLNTEKARVDRFRAQLKAHGKLNREKKQTDPKAYLEERRQIAIDLNPGKGAEINKRAEAFLSRLYAKNAAKSSAK